jgi:hypothetical protein
MTSASDEKWRSFNYFFSRLGLRTYQHPVEVHDLNVVTQLPVQFLITVKYATHGNTHSVVAAQDYLNMAECPSVQILAAQQCDPHLNVHYLFLRKAKTENIIQDLKKKERKKL